MRFGDFAEAAEKKEFIYVTVTERIIQVVTRFVPAVSLLPSNPMHPTPTLPPKTPETQHPISTKIYIVSTSDSLPLSPEPPTLSSTPLPLSTTPITIASSSVGPVKTPIRPQQKPRVQSHSKSIPKTITSSKSVSTPTRVLSTTSTRKSSNSSVESISFWYPDELGWQHSAPRMIIKKEPEFQTFHRWLVSETEVGNISRQEAVSMIPPLLLDVKPDHWVLDMCAAPGSKTTQIIEAIHANDAQDTVIPSGIVIANDADPRRSYTLVHQAKRLRSPCLLVTNHDAAQFPGIYVKQGTDDVLRPIQFDRILVDVPCSGDGTLRKNYLVWKDWNIGRAIGIHYTQVKILLRGAQLVKDNGRIVYSTCSMNPLENEAVVAEVLRRCRGNLQLVDVSDQLPQLIRAPGLTTWKVMSKENVWVDSLEDINPKYRKKYERSLWPPSNANDLNLEKCMRIYPHFQDTGGFFIAVLQKTGPITDISSVNDLQSFSKEDHNNDEETVDASSELDTEIINDDAIVDDDSSENFEDRESDVIESAHKKRSNSGSSEDELRKRTKTEELNDIKDDRSPSQRRGGEEPFLFLEPDNQDIPIIREYYGLSEEFPIGQLLVRSTNEKNKTIYLVSEAVKRVLEASDSKRLKIINTGIRAFTRQEANEAIKCDFRFNAEGLSTIHPFISDKRVVEFELEDLRILLSEPTPLIERFCERIKEKLKNLGKFSLECLQMCALEILITLNFEIIDIGCIVAFIKSDKEHDAIALPVWRATASLNLLYRKEERKSLEHRILNYILKLEEKQDEK
ncbi:12913_t:CDS:10 [Acaulospora morrowiae]|uniref:12913_t:CDS:1 n=1 Tax=Acaulospora morrowiae TaxID=94023 RepID=A0A9N8WD90_9GLOM|nr:12913_t:CDS:10 [Acaulospora morrowiae]